jgi:hypothetical protein
VRVANSKREAALPLYNISDVILSLCSFGNAHIYVFRKGIDLHDMMRSARELMLSGQ